MFSIQIPKRNWNLLINNFQCDSHQIMIKKAYLAAWFNPDWGAYTDNIEIIVTLNIILKSRIWSETQITLNPFSTIFLECEHHLCWTGFQPRKNFYLSVFPVNVFYQCTSCPQHKSIPLLDTVLTTSKDLVLIVPTLRVPILNDWCRISQNEDLASPYLLVLTRRKEFNITVSSPAFTARHISKYY